MARLPPATGGPKYFLAKQKGPGSTRTLTTNTHTTTTGVSSVIHDPSVPRTYLFDIYKNEAESHFEIGEYRQAADCYNAAIKLQPNDPSAIVSRSRCYCQMGRWKRAMKDCDEALSIDAAFGEALYQKADILYVNGNLDLALVYFKRALRQGPDSIRYKNAVQKVSEAIHKNGPAAAHKTSKLTAVGDLSMFLHSKTRQRKTKDTPRLEDEEKFELPSAGFRARFNVGPLIRINRKPGVSILRTYRNEPTKSADSADSAHREPDEGTMRAILGELYGDRKYLKKFQNNLPGGKAERDLTLLADEGLDFLRERTMFWDSLGPLPPPQVPKRSNMRERSFYMTNPDPNSTLMSGSHSNSTTKIKTPRGFNPGHSDDEGGRTTTRLPPVKESTFTVDISGDEGGKSKKAPNFKRQKSNLNLAPKRTPRKGKKLEEAMGLERDVSNVDFKFRSLQPSRSASRTDDIPDMDSLPLLRDLTRTKTRMGRTMFVGMDDPATDRKREITKFINREMDNIDEAFKTGEYEDCKNKAEICLRTVASLPGDDINKNEVMASLHSCLGNACIALNDFDGALTHHLEALTIGETENLQEVVNRSLGHLGRMYIIQKRFNKALEVFARKAPAVVSAEEVAQVFHEIGNCFLALGHLDYARDCGKKALKAALESDIHYFKFQSWVLIAVSESRLKHHDEAYKAFEQALDLAQRKDDNESVTVILFAMEHLSKTITSIMRKRAMLSERLMSRSRTQTILDLNKRPHAARVKKKKKRLRREDTDLQVAESAMTTRQNTMMLNKEVTWLDDNDNYNNDDDDNEKSREDGIDEEEESGGGGGLLLSPEYRRDASVMFEKSPRELEPFGDPNFKKQKQKQKEKQMAAALSRQGTHSRHGMLDAIGGGGDGGSRNGSRRGSWDYREEKKKNSSGGVRAERNRDQHHETPTRLEIPITPRDVEEEDGSGRGGSGSGRHRKGNKGKLLREEVGGGGGDTRLSPLRNIHGGGGDGSETPQTGRREGGGKNEQGYDVDDADSTLPPDGFLSQREEYYHPSRGGMHSHMGGFHSNRESRTDNHNDSAMIYPAAAAGGGAGTGADSGSRSDTESAAVAHHRRAGGGSGGGAKSKLNASMNMGSLRETPLVEEGERNTNTRGKGDNRNNDNNGENLGDVTGVSSGPVVPALNSRAGGQFSPRMNDLSITMESSFREVDLDMTETPRDNNSNDNTPRYKDGSSDLHNTSTRSRRVAGGNARKTPGRFTRESYYDENPDVTLAGGNTDPSSSMEHISVSRAHHHRNKRQVSNEERNRQRENVANREEVTRRINENMNKNNDEVRNDRNDNNNNNHDAERGEKHSARHGVGVGVMSLERQSSKVSVRGKSKEEMMVTLETSKPYRVSSATSVRSARSNRDDEERGGGGGGGGGGGRNIRETKESGKRQDSTGEGAADGEGRKGHGHYTLGSPDRSQGSGFTTGSGWEGDVSTEDATKLGVKKDKEAMRKGRTGGGGGGGRTDGEEGERSRKENGRDENAKRHKSKHREKANAENININKTTREDSNDYKHPHYSTTMDDSKLGPMTNDDVTLPLHDDDTETTVTVTTLKATEVKADVIKNTVENSAEHQKIVMDAKESYLDKKQATRLQRDMRDLEDIPSASHTHASEKASDKMAMFNAMTTRPFPDHEPGDPAVSTTIPLSDVSGGQHTPEHS